MPDKKTKGRRPMIESLETRRLLSSTAVTPNLVLTAAAANGFSGYTPAEIKKAYGFDQITDNGAGQTIAIVDAYDDPNIAADLKAFDAKYGLADTTLTKISETGGSTKNVAASADWSAEIALDVEWAHAIAPNAKIDLVEANSDSLTDLLAAVDVARRLSGVSVVSMSWGSSEFYGETYYDKYFTTPKGHEGVTFVAASGDEGSWYGPDFPATSAYVLAVGGTTLNLTGTGTYAGETGWSDSTGGVSGVVSEPSYQAAVQNTGLRSSPDVSYDANPNTGFAIYDSYGSGGWAVVGGTSAGAPQWAALVALADQARAAKGLSTLDGATSTLPTLYTLYNSSSTYSADFHDVVGGQSSVFYSATTGYDAVTGLGTPEVSGVVSALISATTTPLTSVASTRSRRRSAARVSAAVAKDTTVDSTVIPNRPKTIYAIGQSQGPEIFQALVNAPTLSEPTVQFKAAPISPSSVYTMSIPLAQDGTCTTEVSAVPSQANSVASAFSIATPNLDAAAAALDVANLFSGGGPALALPTPVIASATLSHAAAWATTLGILAVDAVLVGRWYVQHVEEKRRSKQQPSPFGLQPIARQGGGPD